MRGSPYVGFLVSGITDLHAREIEPNKGPGEPFEIDFSSEPVRFNVESLESFGELFCVDLSSDTIIEQP